MGVSTLFLATATVLVGAAAYRMWLRHRGHQRQSDTPILIITLALGLSFVFLSPVMQAVESRIADSLGRLLSNTCTLIAAFGFLHLMLYVHYPAEQVRHRLRPRLQALIAALAVMLVAFLISDPPAGTGIFTGLYASQPSLAVYALAYALYLSSAVADVAVLAVQSLRHTRAWLRLGMAWLALACLLATGYLVDKVAGVLTEVLTGSVAEGYCPAAFATWGCTFSVGMPALSVLAIILGITTPTVGPRLEHLVRALGRWRSYRQLAVLHTALDNTLQHGDATASAPAGRAAERLYQRVVALRDGLLLLQPYRDPDDTRRHHEQASHVAPHRRAAAVEAADIRAALARYHHGNAPAGSSDTAPGYDDFTRELRWLLAVADAFQRGEITPVTTTTTSV